MTDRQLLSGANPGAWVTAAVRACGAAAATIGSTWFVLWLGGVPPRWSAHGVITMKTNMALAHVLAGAALVLLGGRATPGRRAAAVVASALVLVTGALTLAEHLFQVDFGIDQMFATEPPGAPGTAAPNRMGPPGAMTLTLLGAGLLALALDRRGSAPLGIAASCLVLVPAVGMVYGIGQLHSIPTTTGIARSSVVGLALLSVGLILAPRTGGEVPLVWRRDPGGVLLRRMLVPAVLLPVIAGFLRLQGERMGLYGTSVGTGLFAVALVAIFVLLLWRSAVQLSASAADRSRAVSEVEHAAELLDLGDAFVEVDRDWRFVRVNPNYERLSRKRRAELIGRVLWEVFPESAQADSQHWREYRRCMEERVPVQFDQYYGRLELWAGVSAYPTRNGGVAIFTRDITDRKRAEEALRASEERLRALVTASSDAVYRMNADWSEMRQLHAERSFIGETRTATSHWMEKYIPPDERPRVTEAIEEAIRTKRPFELEHRVLRVDGSLGWTFSRAVPIEDPSGAIVEWFGAASDVTDRKRAEEALLHANAKLREADRRKDEFLGMLSHELRNPLAPIRNSIYVLRRANPASEESHRAREVIERQTEHLTRLVDDLLDATRITTGKAQIRRARVDLMGLVRQAVDDHRPLFSDRDITVDLVGVAGPLWVDGDPNRLAQVMSNLLMNAVKFTQEGGRVTVGVAVGSDAGTATIDVTDTGMGIERALLPRLFEPFTQGPQALDRKYGGVGLGLAIVKSLVELHGGSVTAHSDGSGQGARFKVQLPLVAVSTPAEGGGRRGARHVARRVLVIEDNRDMAHSLKDILEMEGHEVAMAFDGEEGIAKALEFGPNVVLCDIGLPRMSGYAVAQALRANEALGAATLIALTGYASPEDRRHAVEAGFDHHFAKPPKVDQILEAVMTARPGPPGGKTIGA